MSTRELAEVTPKVQSFKVPTIAADGSLLALPHRRLCCERMIIDDDPVDEALRAVVKVSSVSLKPSDDGVLETGDGRDTLAADGGGDALVEDLGEEGLSEARGDAPYSQPQTPKSTSDNACDMRTMRCKRRGVRSV